MKKYVVICAPVTSRSGYGDHARDLVEGLLENDNFNVRILDVPWGQTPRNALDKNNKIHELIRKKMASPLNPIDDKKQPDLYIDIRIPNEFQNPGKYNIGITAGIETNAVSQTWLEGCNKMDLIIVPSEHSRHGFVQSIYDKVNNTPDGQQQVVGQLKLDKPMEVLFEGADEDVYKPLHHKDIDKDFFNWLNTEVPEKFAFLSVGLWGKGDYGEDRKDVSRLLKIFYESFANKKKRPALILKTNGAGFSILDKEDILKKMKQMKNHFPNDWELPNVYLLHGSLSSTEMNYLYNHPKIKALVSLTHGEGFGRPLLEATMTGLPVIASNWSGHLDFLDKEKSILLGGQLQDVPESQVWEDILIKESKWFVIDENQTYKIFNFAFENKYEVKNNAKSLMYKNREKFTLNNMAKVLDEMIGSHIKDMPEQVSIKLPKLKKSKPKMTLEEETV